MAVLLSYFQLNTETKEMSVEISNYATILIELVKAVKMHNFYPQGHPQLESIIEKSYLALKKSIDTAGEFKWRIDQRGFYFEKLPLAPGNAEIAGLAKKLFFRRIKEITFLAQLDMNDIKVCLSAVNAEPEEIQAKGGVEAFFASLDINGILLNEQRYEDIKKLKNELEAKKEAEKAAAEEKQEQPAGESEKAQEEQEEKPKEEVKQDSLETLISKIRGEKDDLRYKDLSARITELLTQGKAESVYPCLIVFYEHTLPASGRSDFIKKTALEGIKGLLTREMLKFLASRIGAKQEHNRAAAQNILVYAGDEGAQALLDAIIEAQDAMARRYIFNALVIFGGRIRPLIEARLDHPEWYVVRQMAALLGAIGGPEAMDALETAYKNPELRVKKEVLKSMVKIRTPRVTEFLLKALGEENQSLVAQAIISLGIIKDPSAVEPLAELAFKREAFSDASETSKEAVKALGIIGDTRAVPHLEKILFRTVWFGKKANDEVRSLAAYSLGLIGTTEALDAVDAVYAESTGELHMACKRVLDGRERTS